MANSIVRLTVEDSSFNAKIKAAAKAFADFGKNVASAGADAFQKFASGATTAKVAFQGFNTVLKANALVLVATLAVQVGQAIGEMIGDWISGADDAEAAQRRLNDELDRTAQLVKSILAESDFNARIAKAAGKSTSEILQMKYQAADAAYNKAMSALFDPNVKVGTEEYDKAKKIFEQAEKARTKAWQDIQVDNTAREHKTGEYAVKGGGGSGSGGVGGGRSSGGNKPELTEMQQNQQTINTLTQEYVRISDNANEETRQRQEEIRKEIQLLEQRNNLLKLRQEQAQGKLLGGDVQTEGLATGEFAALPEIGKGLSDETIEKVREGMQKMNQTALTSKQAFGLAANAAGALGSALAGIEDPGTRAAGLVLQSIASIALGFAQAAASPLVTGTGWGWLAFLAAGAAAMATTISTVHQLTGFAQGGIVDGNSYSGDNIPIMANAGEVVLTKAMQGNLASSLQGNGMQNMNIAGRIKGTDIILSIDRSLKLEGKQLLTWGR